jgi:hypothetical protein
MPPPMITSRQRRPVSDHNDSDVASPRPTPASRVGLRTHRHSRWHIEVARAPRRCQARAGFRTALRPARASSTSISNRPPAVRGLDELKPTSHQSISARWTVPTAVAPGWPIPGVTAPCSQKRTAVVRENPDPYLVLGVSPTATQAEITHAYRTRLRAHHPDTRRPQSSQTADEHLRQVLAAYALLRDPARRADHDRATALAAKPPPHSPQGPIPVDRPRTGGVQIPISYRTTNTSTARGSSPPLWAGPVRRNR